MSGLHAGNGLVEREELQALTAEFSQAADSLLGNRLPVLPEASPDELIARHSDLWPELADLGWFEMLVPEQHDGLGLPPSLPAAMFRSVGRHLAPGPLAGTIFAGPWLACRLGNGALAAAVRKKRFAVVDEFSGDSDGIPCIADADELIVATGRYGEPCLLRVPVAGSGISIETSRAIDPAWSFAQLRVTSDLRDTATVLQSGAAAIATVAELRAWERILMASETAGLVAHVLEISVRYAKDRSQFGRPIGSFQAIKHILATMACEVSTLENLLDITLEESDAMDDDELRTAACILKSHASVVGTNVCELALQVHGGIGFTAEYELHLFFKRSLTLSTYLGAPPELNTAVGRRALGGATPW